jgi:hypothetical protein
MEYDNLSKSQLKRVNPFPGLIIDAEIWRDAHEYHRSQQKLHIQAFHQSGIVQGLEVKASSPPDLSVTIEPGMGADSEGNMIIVSEPQLYHLQTRKRGVVYLIIQFREIPVGPLQPLDGGQPTRIMEAYRIQECDKFPSEPFLELARIDFDPTIRAVKDAISSDGFNKNEVVLSYRIDAKQPGIEKPGSTQIEAAGDYRNRVKLAHMVLGEAERELHTAGLKNLVREIKYRYNFVAELEENIPLTIDINRFDVLYLTGNGRFELTQEKQGILGNFLKTGGTIFAEGCSAGDGEEGIKAGREFGLAVNRLAGQLKYRLGTIQRQHPLLSAIHVFPEAPRGAQSATLLEGDPLFYSGNDYGCAWQGGYPSVALPREAIRGAFEMGANILAYAQLIKASYH